MEKICICGHVKACHTLKCSCGGCVQWEEQDLLLRTLNRIIDGYGLKHELGYDSIVIEKSMLRLLRGAIINLHRENQRLKY